MPFVPVPKDLTKVKTKVVFNLTKRQLVCFSIAAAIGIPSYIFSRSAIGNSAALLVMIGLMLPAFFMAMFEKDGQPAEKVIRNFVRARLLCPARRPYKTDNLYNYLAKEGKRFESAQTAGATTGAPAPKHPAGQTQ